MCIMSDLAPSRGFAPTVDTHMHVCFVRSSAAGVLRDSYVMWCSSQRRMSDPSVKNTETILQDPMRFIGMSAYSSCAKDKQLFVKMRYNNASGVLGEFTV